MPSAGQGAVVVVTISWARNATDEERLGHALSQLATIRLPVVIADRGNSPSFTGFLQRLPNVHLTTAADGLVAQVRAALTVAADLQPARILYTEPDKSFFFQHRLVRFVERAARLDATAVSIAARSPESFESYPSMQRYTEAVFNRICGDLLGARGDYCYGPFLLPPTLLSELHTVPADLNWGWRPAMFRAAAAHGLTLRHLVDDLPCPDDQRCEDADERRHRVRQLSENLRGLLHDHGAFSF